MIMRMLLRRMKKAKLLRMLIFMLWSSGEISVQLVELVVLVVVADLLGGGLVTLVGWVLLPVMWLHSPQLFWNITNFVS